MWHGTRTTQTAKWSLARCWASRISCFIEKIQMAKSLGVGDFGKKQGESTCFSLAWTNFGWTFLKSAKVRFILPQRRSPWCSLVFVLVKPGLNQFTPPPSGRWGDRSMRKPILWAAASQNAQREARGKKSTQSVLVGKLNDFKHVFFEPCPSQLHFQLWMMIHDRSVLRWTITLSVYAANHGHASCRLWWKSQIVVKESPGLMHTQDQRCYPCKKLQSDDMTWQYVIKRNPSYTKWRFPAILLSWGLLTCP